MARYAVIQGGLVENVIVADTKPTYPGRTVVALTNEAVSPGDSYNGSTFTPRVPSAREIGKAGAAPNLVAIYQAARARATQLRGVANALAGPLTVAQQQTLLRYVADLYDFDADLLLQLDLDGS